MKTEKNLTILEKLRKNKTNKFTNLKTNLYLRLLVIFYSIKKHSLLFGKTIGYKFLKEIRKSKLPYSIKLMMIKTHISNLSKLNTVKSNSLIVKDKFVFDIDRMKQLFKYFDDVRNTPYFNRMKDSDNLFGNDPLLKTLQNVEESPKPVHQDKKISKEQVINSTLSSAVKNMILNSESPLLEINRPVVFENKAFSQSQPITTKEKLQKLISKSKFDYIMGYLDKCCKQEPSKGGIPLYEDFNEIITTGRITIGDDNIKILSNE